MEVLTEDVTRLRDEIVAWRNHRRELISDLVRQARNRKADVAAFCNHLAIDLTAMARRAKAVRSSSLAHLRQNIAARRQEIRLDLAGARRAWGGLFPVLAQEDVSGEPAGAGTRVKALSSPARLRMEKFERSEAGTPEPDAGSAKAASRRHPPSKAHGKRR